MIRSRAPFRVSFSGGGTDVPPYPQKYGGAVLSSTIRKYAYCTITLSHSDGLHITDLLAKPNNGADSDGNTVNGHDKLVEAAAKRLGISDGLDVQLGSDCPPGCGLGSSSAIVVSVLGALSEWVSNPMEKENIARLACQVERSDVGVPGGLQDQYAASFGGFNFMEFTADGVKVTPLGVPKNVRYELEYRLLLCSTGITRASGGILRRQIQSYKSGRKEVLEPLHEIKRLTYQFERKLLQGDLEEFGRLLGEEWELKKKLDGAISNEHVDRLYKVALENGAIGGKLLGAGGGGYLLLFAQEGSQNKIASALLEHGSTTEPVRFEDRGLETWKVSNGTRAQPDVSSPRNHFSGPQEESQPVA